MTSECTIDATYSYILIRHGEYKGKIKWPMRSAIFFFFFAFTFFVTFGLKTKPRLKMWSGLMMKDTSILKCY